LVCISEQRWRHLVEEHVREPGEPWGQWLSLSLVEALIGVFTQVHADDYRRQTLEAASRIVGQDVWHCLRAPLAITYEFERSGGTIRTWLLVLPSGARMVIYTAESAAVWTCFFRGTNRKRVYKKRKQMRERARLRKANCIS
jgi:hypothetical protein